MTIVFDMDNTLVDELGAAVRPGIPALLQRLRKDGHTLVLWTNSRRERAVEILRLHGLRPHFAKCLFREDYDPDDRGLPKDIRKVEADLLVDDDPALCDFVRAHGGRAVQVSSYRKGRAASLEELRELYRSISRPPAGRLSPAFGSALGFLLGDMLGSPFEGFGYKAAAEGYLKKIGSYTDDTLMYLAVLEAFARRRPLARTLVERYQRNRGYGGRMEAMLSRGRCEPTDSWGNGAATRTAALALFPRATIGDAVAYCRVTHTHPQAIACSRAVFVAVRQALRCSRDLGECWRILGAKKPLAHYAMGLAAAESIPPALIVYETTTSFDEALRTAISLGGDTDSIGAVTGALAGACYGVPAGFQAIARREKAILSALRKRLPR